MPKARGYIETTIPSFYHELRTTPDIVARRDWTRGWWADAASRYELVSSSAVLDELAEGLPDLSAARIALLADIPLLAVEPPIVEIVQAYVGHRLMPADPGGDALHLAVASYHKCDF